MDREEILIILCESVECRLPAAIEPEFSRIEPRGEREAAVLLRRSRDLAESVIIGDHITAPYRVEQQRVVARAGCAVMGLPPQHGEANQIRRQAGVSRNLIRERFTVPP